MLGHCFDSGGSNTVSLKDAGAPDRALDELKRGVKEGLRNHPANAEKHFRKALKIYPEYDSAIAGLAESLTEQGNWEGAEELSLSALSRAPNHPALLRVEASIAQHANRFEESVPMLKRVLSMEPHSESALVLLARAELVAGNCAKAIAHAQLAHAQTPHPNSIAHIISATCQERFGNRSAAQSEYELFLKEEPVGEASEYVQRRLKDFEKHLARSDR